MSADPSPSTVVIAPVLPALHRKGKVAFLLRSFRRDVAGAVGVVICGAWVLTALFGPLIVSGDPNAGSLNNALRPPAWMAGGSVSNLLGTDNLGRDLLLRAVHGARLSLLICIVSVLGAVLIGTVLGAIAAEWRGAIDELVMRAADIQLAIPTMLLAVTVLAVLGGSLRNMVLVLVVTGWVIYARVVRSELLALREVEFVSAARSYGASRLRIVFRHMLPNVMGTIVVIATIELSNVIVLEAALSFLGVGIQAPGVSWGGMLASGRDYLTSAWWIAVIPGVAITLVVLGVNLLGDWLRDLLDPRRRKL
jgi:peptide/nickel transport system permease protein